MLKIGRRGMIAGALAMGGAASAKASMFKPNWSSLTAGWDTPECFRDAKFGLWAHWGPQCPPEAGDW